MNRTHFCIFKCIVETIASISANFGGTFSLNGPSTCPIWSKPRKWSTINRQSSCFSSSIRIRVIFLSPYHQIKFIICNGNENVLNPLTSTKSFTYNESSFSYVRSNMSGNIFVHVLSPANTIFPLASVIWWSNESIFSFELPKFRTTSMKFGMVPVVMDFILGIVTVGGSTCTFRWHALPSLIRSFVYLIDPLARTKSARSASITMRTMRDTCRV